MDLLWPDLRHPADPGGDGGAPARGRSGALRAAAVATPRREYVAEAYQRLRDLIVQGKLGPGVRLIDIDFKHIGFCDAADEPDPLG